MGTSQSNVEVLTSLSAHDSPPAKQGPDNFGLTRHDYSSKHWTTLEVAQWLRDNGLSQYESCFEQNDIDGEAINLLTDQQLRKIMGNHSDVTEHLNKMRASLRHHDRKCEESDMFPTTSATGIVHGLRSFDSTSYVSEENGSE
jgi:hypothetical protein